jgi:hypothetical protein
MSAAVWLPLPLFCDLSVLHLPVPYAALTTNREQASMDFACESNVRKIR